MDLYMVDCEGCDANYEQQTDAQPTICGACGCHEIEVWKRVQNTCTKDYDLDEKPLTLDDYKSA